MTLNIHDIKWQGLCLWKASLVSPYCKIQKRGRRTPKVFVLMEHTWSLISTPRFSRATAACLLFPVCICSYHCRIFPRWKVRTCLCVCISVCSPWGLSAPHISHQWSTCTAAITSARCTDLLCICRLCIQHMLVFLFRKSQTEMWEPNIWQNSCVSWVYKQLNPDVIATFFCL